MSELSPNMPSPDELQELIAQNNLAELEDRLQSIHPADIALLLDELPTESRVIIFNLLSNEVASEVLDETDGIVRQDLVEKIDDERLADLLDELPMDDAAEFLEDLPDLIADRLLDLMEPQEAEEVRGLLAYEDETAGRLMTRDVITLRRQWSVNETLEYLRSLEDAEMLHYLYVLDREDQLIGVIPIRELILAQPSAIIEDLMETDVVSVPVTADQEELAEMVARYDFVAIPVVDHDGRFVGIVTVDDVLDIFEEEVTEDIHRLGGSEPFEQSYFSVSIGHMVRKRIGWLLLLFLAATLTGTVINLFQAELDTVITLSLFIPLIIGTGGNAGTQTVAIVIRAITLDEVRISNLFAAWRREISVGFLLGLAMAGVGFLRAVLWNTGLDVALVVALTLPIVVMWSTTIAITVPTLADHFNIDPTVISGPMISTTVDATGLLLYFTLAKLILNL